MSEWLRRWTANPLGSARAGSNPADVEFLRLWCSGNISAFQADASGSIPDGRIKKKLKNKNIKIQSNYIVD
jgi:hypothetical protein